MKSDWDSTLPKEVKDKWRGFYEDLDQLKAIRVPRSSRVKSSLMSKCTVSATHP